MPVIDVVRALAPRGKAAYLKGFEQFGDAQIAAAGINTPLRLAHFLARVMSETGNLDTLVENMNYSRQNLSNQWDRGNGHKQFPNKATMMSYAGKPEALANRWYGGRGGNGPPASGDGFRYRGRGPLQTTFKAAYRKYGAKIGVDLVADPDLLLEPQNILQPSLSEWQDTGCNAYADNDDALSIARIINVGTLLTKQIPNGYDDQVAALKKAKAAIAKVGWVPTGQPIAITVASGGAGTAPAAEIPSEDTARQIQERLKSLGYTEVGETKTGVWGTRSRGALGAFELAMGLPRSPGGIPTKATLDVLFDTRTAARPVSEERATATLADLRPESPVLQQAQQVKGLAGLGGIGVTVCGVGQAVLENFPTAKGLIAPVQEMLTTIPPIVWFLVAAGIAFGIWHSARKVETSKLAAYRAGADAGGT